MKFTLSADAAELIRAEQQVTQSQSQVERGFEREVQAADRASRQMAAAIQHVVKEYELADRRISSLSFTPAAGAGGRGPRAYGLAPIASAPTAAAAMAQFTGNPYLLAGDISHLRLNAAQRTDLLGDPFAAHTAAEGVAAQVRADYAARKAAEKAAIGQGDSDFKAEMVGGLGRLALGTTAAVYATTRALEGYAEIAHRAGEANAEFQKSMAPLLSLGDNAQHVAAIEGQVLDLSSAWGRAAPEVAAAAAEVQRMMQGVDAAGQTQMLTNARELTDLIGGSLSENLRTAAKLWQAYGASAGDAGTVAGKLLNLYRGGVPVESLELLANLTPAAKEAGFSADEMAAMLKTITVMGGKDSKLARAGAEFFTHFDALRQGGLDLSGAGGLDDKIVRLREFVEKNPDVAARLFPRGGSVLVKELSDNVALLTRNLRELQAVTGREVEAAGVQRIAEPAVRAAMNRASITAATGNADVLRGLDPSLRGIDEARGLAKLGEKLAPNSAFWEAITPNAFRELKYSIAGRSSGAWGADEVAAGVLAQAGQLRASTSLADHVRADLLEVGYGSYLDLHFHDQFKNRFRIQRADGSSRYTGPEDANTVAELYTKLPSMTQAQGLQYLQMRELGGQRSADSYFSGISAEHNASGAHAVMMDAARLFASAAKMIHDALGVSGGTRAAIPATFDLRHAAPHVRGSPPFAY